MDKSRGALLGDAGSGRESGLNLVETAQYPST